MQISSRSDYAVRALLQLAMLPDGEAAPLAEVATRTNIPHKYLERIFRVLREAGLLDARRGHSGGYVLARPAPEITIGEVIRILDGPLAPMRCAGDEEYAPCPEYLCPNEATCVLRDVWLDVRDAISSVLDETTFADLAHRQLSQPGETVAVIDIYAQPPEARRRHWARRSSSLDQP